MESVLSCKGDDYQRCLKWICENDAEIPICCSYDGGVYPCTWAARDLKISVNKVRQIMKQLEADGYVRKGSVGGYDDWNERIWCIHGYAATSKVCELTWWKEKRAQEEEDLRRMAEDEYS